MTSKEKLLFRAVCFGHFIIDMFSASGPVLLAFAAGHVMNLSNLQIGFAVSGYQIVGAFSQPFFGYRADRSGGRFLGAGSVAWTVTFLMLSMLGATTGQYPLMVIPFILAALGSGAFHPVGAMYAAEVNKPRAAHYTSLFFLSGQIGAGIGPALIGVLLDRTATNNAAFGASLGPAFADRFVEHGTLSPIGAMALLALPSIIFLLATIPSRLAFIDTHPPILKAERKATPPLATSTIVLLAVVIAMRSLANPGSVAFLPRLFQLKGWTAAEYGVITSLFWLAGGIAGVFFARWAVRWGSRAVINVTLMLGGACMFLLPSAQGAAALVLAAAAGALTGGSHSLIVVMTQRLMRARKGFASGMTLGYIFGMGAFGTLLIGALADRVGVDTAYQIVALVTIVTGLMALRLPVDAILEGSSAASPTPISVEKAEAAA